MCINDLTHGYVYFVQCTYTKAIKIGYSNSLIALERRVKNLGSGSPFPLIFLAAVKGTLNDEKTYHSRFSDSRLNGEWFKPSQELLQFVDNLPVISINTNHNIDKINIESNYYKRNKERAIKLVTSPGCLLKRSRFHSVSNN